LQIAHAEVPVIPRLRRRWLRALALGLALCCLTASSGARQLLAADVAGDPKPQSVVASVFRNVAAFALTTGIKGLFGMAPGYLQALIPTVCPAMAMPVLIGAGLLEGAISLTVATAILGKENRRWLVRSFLLASALSSVTTYFLAPMLAPWVTVVVSNLVRMAIFSLLTKPPNVSMTSHLINEVESKITGENSEAGTGKTTEPKASLAPTCLSVVELERPRREAYNQYLLAEGPELREAAYADFKRYTEQLAVAAAAAAR
jgi:hypothetical protein